MTLAAVSLLGVGLFLWPFLGLDPPGELAALSLTVAGIAALVLVEHGTRRLDSGRLALLAALAAIEAALRLALVNGIGGFSPIFFLILVAGYAFGPSFGFLLGAFGLLVSAIVTGGVGPWLPYEMFAAGWVGVAAGTAGLIVRGRRATARPMVGARDIAALVVVAVVTGYAYGAVTDTWQWVIYYRDVPVIGWSPSLAPLDALVQFGRFYVATSLAWDTFRAVGDALAVFALAAPVLIALGRLRARLGFEIVPIPAGEAAAASE